MESVSSHPTELMGDHVISAEGLCFCAPAWCLPPHFLKPCLGAPEELPSACSAAEAVFNHGKCCTLLSMTDNQVLNGSGYVPEISGYPLQCSVCLNSLSMTWRWLCCLISQEYQENTIAGIWEAFKCYILTCEMPFCL